jgi:hypothetical protein
MNRLICLILAIFLVASCSTLNDERLYGTYISDKIATLEYLESTGNYTPDHLDRLGKILGKMRITYRNDNVAIIEYDGQVFEDKFKIVEISSDQIVIVTESNSGYSKFKINFEEDGYWAASL